MVLQQVVSFQNRKDSGRLNATLLHWCFHYTRRHGDQPIFSILHCISKSLCFPYIHTSKTSGNESEPFFLLLSALTWISPVSAELRETDGLWEYLMTFVFPSQAVSFHMWDLSSPCRQQHIFRVNAVHIVMCPEWQIARISPWGIVDFSQEGCLLSEMWFRPAWHFSVLPWSFLTDRNLLLASPGWYHILPPYCPTASESNNRRIDYTWTTEQHSEECVYCSLPPI